jgi:hypothetical protein
MTRKRKKRYGNWKGKDKNVDVCRHENLHKNLS